MRRLTPALAAVRQGEEERQDEERREGYPGEPRECDEGGEDAAGEETLAPREGTPEASRDGRPDNVEEP